MKKLFFLSILLPLLAAAQVVPDMTEVKPVTKKVEPVVYQGLAPLNINWELANRFLFTEQEELHGVTFFDRRYVCVPKETMEKWIAAAFKKVDQTYVSELHDCDDKAWEMLVFLRREVMKAHPDLGYSICAGMAAVKITQPISELGTDFTGDHAVVLTRVKDGTWWIIEPGTGKGVKLDEVVFEGRLQLCGVWF